MQSITTRTSTNATREGHGESVAAREAPSKAVPRALALARCCTVLAALIGLLLCSGADAPVHAQPSAMVPRRAAILAPDRPSFLSNFGFAVSIDGDRALVAAPGKDSNGRLGAAYIFERDAGGANAWGLVATLVPEPRAGIHLGYSVALDGDRALVGAGSYGEAGTDNGSAFLFERDAGGANAWGQVAKLLPARGHSGDMFGYSVALSGDTALVGASEDDERGTAAGAVYVFEWNRGGDGAWGEVAKLTAADGTDHASFGNAVSLSGDTALVGAYLDDDDLGASGSAYVFERDGSGAGAWREAAKLRPADDMMGGTFGRSVALDGDTAVIGATAFYGEGRMGSAYVFERAGGARGRWRQVAKLDPADGAPDQWFGTSVAVSGDRAIVGAHKGLDALQGAAYVYERTPGDPREWAEVARLTSGEEGFDEMGVSVALSGDTALLGGGVDHSREPGFGYGTAHVYDWVAPAGAVYLPAVVKGP